MLLRFHIAVGAFFFVLICGFFLAFLHASRLGELADKRSWSALQGMDDAPAQSGSVVLQRTGEFAFLGFRGVGQPEDRIRGAPAAWSWVLLNEHHIDGEIKQMPEFGGYELPCSELRRIQGAVPDADAYVLRYLGSICT